MRSCRRDFRFFFGVLRQLGYCCDHCVDQRYQLAAAFAKPQLIINFPNEYELESLSFGLNEVDESSAIYFGADRCQHNKIYYLESATIPL